MRVAFLLAIALFAFPALTTAQGSFAPNCPGIYEGTNAGVFTNVQCQCVAEGTCSATDFMWVVFNASQLVFGIAGAAALIMFIVGGFMLIISSGNAAYVDRGKQILRAAVIGLVIIFGAWIVVNGIVVGLTGNPQGTIFNSQTWFIFQG